MGGATWDTRHAEQAADETRDRSSGCFETFSFFFFLRTMFWVPNTKKLTRGEGDAVTVDSAKYRANIARNFQINFEFKYLGVGIY